MPKTPDQTYEPTYPRGGSFGIIPAANGPFVERAYPKCCRARSDGFNATLFSDQAGAKACASLRRQHRRLQRPTRGTALRRRERVDDVRV